MVADNNNDQMAHNTSRRKPPLRPGQWVRLLVILLLIVAGLLWLAQWAWYRHTHVVEDNASVATDLVTVSSRLAGRIEQFDIEAGDRLEQNDPVAILYSRPDQLELQRRQARVASMEARLAFEKHQITLAEQQLAGGTANAERQLQTDLAALKVAEAELENAEQIWQRSERLYESKTLSAQQRDRDYYNLLSARARHEQARQQVALRRTELANADQGLLSGAQMTLPTPELLKARLTITRQELKEAKAELEQQQARVDDMSITSPATGVVTRTFVEAGEYLSPGQPILMMHQPENVWVEAKVKETKVRDLKVGQNVKIDVDAYPGKSFRGRVEVIGHAATSQFALLPSSNPSGNFTKITQRIPVRISVEEGDRARLSPGMMVVVAIDVRAEGDGDEDRTGD